MEEQPAIQREAIGDGELVVDGLTVVVADTDAEGDNEPLGLLDGVAVTDGVNDGDGWSCTWFTHAVVPALPMSCKHTRCEYWIVRPPTEGQPDEAPDPSLPSHTKRLDSRNDEPD